MPASSGQFDGQRDHSTTKSYVRQAFRKCLECGIFAHGVHIEPDWATDRDG